MVPTAKKSTPASTNGTTTPVSAPNDSAASASAKPDKKAYDSEQDAFKSEIDTLQTSMNAVRDKIGLITKSGPGKDRRDTLRRELDDIKGSQSQDKRSREKIREQLQAIQDSYHKKIKELNAAKAKSQFKTVDDIDNHIRNLEKQVESGSMKLAEEKRALQEISQSKRTRRIIEAFQKDEDTIQADRRTADDLRKQLDDPETKAVHDRYDTIKKELDSLREEEQLAHAGRSKLFEERDRLHNQINELYTKKKASAQHFREGNDRYWSKLHEDRARRAEKARTQRAADEAEKKKEVATRLREEAEAPAFQAQIEDCQTLIDSLLGKTSGAVSFKSIRTEKTELAGVPKLEIRQVKVSSDDGLLARKKKDDEEEYFVGGKGKKKKGGAKPAVEPKETSSTASTAINVPLPTLSALASLSIPPPSSAADLARVVEDLQTKKAWFTANQSRVTAENIAKAEANIKKILDAAAANAEQTSVDQITPPNGGAERPPEPAPTPSDTEASSIEVPAEAVKEELENIAVAET